MKRLPLAALNHWRQGQCGLPNPIPSQTLGSDLDAIGLCHDLVSSLMKHKPSSIENHVRTHKSDLMVRVAAASRFAYEIQYRLAEYEWNPLVYLLCAELQNGLYSALCYSDSVRVAFHLQNLRIQAVSKNAALAVKAWEAMVGNQVRFCRSRLTPILTQHQRLTVVRLTLGLVEHPGSAMLGPLTSRSESVERLNSSVQSWVDSQPSELCQCRVMFIKLRHHCLAGWQFDTVLLLGEQESRHPPNIVEGLQCSWLSATDGKGWSIPIFASTSPFEFPVLSANFNETVQEMVLHLAQVDLLMRLKIPRVGRARGVYVAEPAETGKGSESHASPLMRFATMHDDIQAPIAKDREAYRIAISHLLPP